ncbi:hypothetical protein [Pseudomonas sp. M30-35]|uniref:hypothetical protein n=1 Tax=Pseudomonas sp. M30-35 TaxID=1981174 RepID=UPI000B3CE7BC|nr:hypothetical protein [Pseudomonas sp. M30-35]ARU87126.1 hypothetical protein B9K09_03620 [Pseudomonas sp. M30-35]
MWVQIAILVVSYLINQANQPKPTKPKPAAFQDFDFPRCDEGTEKEWIFGQVWGKDWMVLAVRNQRSQAIKVKGSKK